MVFAVGDIHGRADLADRILDVVRAEAEDTPASRVILVGLGDYVDRGPQSCEVIDTLVDLHTHPKIEMRCLRGNHEHVLVDFLDNAAAGPAWCEFGGRETLASYNIKAPADPLDAPAWEATRAKFNATLPLAHRAFLQTLALRCVIGDYVFVHAGLRPGVSLQRQRENDMLWIREPFLNGRRLFPKMVVHGHTPTETVHVDDRRIGLDTGAYATGVLSAIRLEGRARHLIHTTPNAGRVDLSSIEI
ncbi:serine/threonine protein phosphatase [Caulobacter hibisci]|uniref:Serine/threonine protein phosphatase n=1 Tax=Caulobacter hibisci TaxID=2035993 RepID=A0ABS0T217_9CAUL|nr:serine/threonine protein phosphatase [Caulobacter hibisci]